MFGFTHATGVGWDLAGILDRVFIRVIFAVLTTLFMGFPPRNEGQVGEPFNAWPYPKCLPCDIDGRHAHLDQETQSSS